MKKLLFLLLSMFAVLGFVGCNGDEPTIPTTVEEEVTLQLDEPLSVPQGLAINEATKTLTWQAVPNATAYNVYANGELKAEVTGTSYDFSSLTGNQLIFTVKAIGGVGFLNSNHSTTIAYVVNLQDEIDLMTAALESNGLMVNEPESFAAEMVSKGMLATDFEAMMLNMALVETMMEMEDMSDMYGVVDQIMDSMDIVMVEALVSALIKTQLPMYLEDELAYLESMDGQCEYEDYWGECWEYYDYSQEILMIETMLDFIENNADDAVGSVMVLINYLMDVQAAISNDMINNVETLLGSMEDFNLSNQSLALMISIKNDMVNNLKNNLPSVEDFVLLNQTMMVFADIMTEEMVEIETTITVAQQSAMARFSIELFFNILLEIDLEYVQGFADLSTSMSASPMMAKDFFKQNIRLLNNVLKNNEDLMNQMNMILSTENKIDMFTEYMYVVFNQILIEEGLDDGSITEQQLRELITTNMKFGQMFALQKSLGESFAKLIEGLVDSDYAIIDIIFEIAALQNPESAALAANDDAYDHNFTIFYNVEPGTYYLLVKGYSSYTTGAYEVFIYGDGDLILNESQYLNEDDMYAYQFSVTEPTLIEAFTSGNTDTYGILVTEEQFLSSPEEANEMGLAFELIKELTSLLNPIIQTTDNDDYQALIDSVFSLFMTGLAFNEMIESEEIPFPVDMVEIIYAAITATSEDQFGIFKNLFNTMSKTQYIDQLETLAAAMDEDEEAMYGLVILIANIYLDFYNASDDHLDNLIDEVLEVLSDPQVMAMTGMATEDLEMVEMMFGELFSGIAQQANIIKNYNYQNLTPQQMEDVMNFMAVFGGFMYSGVDY